MVSNHDTWLRSDFSVACPTDWEHIFEKYNLERQTRFRTNFVRADWDAQRQLYVIQLEDMDDRSKTFTHEAEVLISAIGGFSTPTEKPEGMKGLERFHGTTFHSARWRHDVPLKGKRIGVIGNGCSAGESDDTAVAC